MIPRREPPEKDHGAHTLRVWPGVVVGLHGDDVFVELGTRMQGVISRRAFGAPPRIGEEYEFTLRGQEESLWVLALREQQSLATWEEMEEGSVVQARLIRTKPGGLEGKVGPLHAFLPSSQSGLPRERKIAELVGKTVSCEVIEVDRERQRVVLSRKAFLARERARHAPARLGSLRVGQTIQGRVVRLEPYGAFVRFGRGLEGLIHVSDLAYERVEHPATLLSKGQIVEAQVLSIRQHGKRIGLGTKQLRPSPWGAFAARCRPGDLLAGTLARVLEFGAFVTVARGVQGLVPRAESGVGEGAALRGRLREGERVSVRVLHVDPGAERLALSLLHPDGRRIAPDEAELAADFEELTPEPGAENPLGSILRRALDANGDGTGHSRPM